MSLVVAAGAVLLGVVGWFCMVCVEASAGVPGVVLSGVWA
jgi:hypothetical protein